jgi:hypothetical protein
LQSLSDLAKIDTFRLNFDFDTNDDKNKISDTVENISKYSDNTEPTIKHYGTVYFLDNICKNIDVK